MSAKGGGRVRPPDIKMRKFTKEQLIARLDCHKETATSIAPTVRHLPAAFEMALIDIHLAEITLAALTAEPVGWMTEVEVDELHRGIAEEAYIYRSADSASTLPLYAAPQLPQPVLGHIANVFIAAIEKEQERLHGEDYLMDSKDCIDVILEEIQRLNAYSADMLTEAQGDDHATD